MMISGNLDQQRRVMISRAADPFWCGWRAWRNHVYLARFLGSCGRVRLIRAVTDESGSDQDLLPIRPDYPYSVSDPRAISTRTGRAHATIRADPRVKSGADLSLFWKWKVVGRLSAEIVFNSVTVNVGKPRCYSEWPIPKYTHYDREPFNRNDTFSYIGPKYYRLLGC